MAETKTIAPKEGPGTRFWNWLTETQVWTSIFRHGRVDSDRNRVLVMLSNVVLREHVPLGIMREMHRWGAHAMVITVWLHMFRVFMTGSYKPPREFNWSVGVVMLLLSFTGYLLPWDQLAIWAITVGSGMARATPFLGHEGPGASLLKLGDIPLIHAADDARFALLGGTFVGEGALLRFYVLHCVGLPLGIAVLMAVHFWRVRKDGGISGPL